MIWLLLILITPDESNQVGGIGGKSPAHYHFCGGHTNTSVAFVSGLPTGEDIQYNLNTEEQHPTHYPINDLRLDSNTTDILVFETIVRSAFNVNTLTNDIALLKLKSEVFDNYVQPECLWQPDNFKRLPRCHVFGKELGWEFDLQDVILSSTPITIPVISELTFLKPNTDNFRRDTDISFCRGDSGSELSLVTGWGVATTTKVLPTRRCHWPAFWLVVCPWYGMQHCQSKII